MTKAKTRVAGAEKTGRAEGTNELELHSTDAEKVNGTSKFSQDSKNVSGQTELSPDEPADGVFPHQRVATCASPRRHRFRLVLVAFLVLGLPSCSSGVVVHRVVNLELKTATNRRRL